MKGDEPIVVRRSVDVASSDVGCICSSSKGASVHSSLTGDVLDVAGAGLGLSGVPKGGGYVKAKGASGAPCLSLSVSRVKVNTLAQ